MKKAFSRLGVTACLCHRGLVLLFSHQVSNLVLEDEVLYINDVNVHEQMHCTMILCVTQECRKYHSLIAEHGFSSLRDFLIVKCECYLIDVVYRKDVI